MKRVREDPACSAQSKKQALSTGPSADEGYEGLECPICLEVFASPRLLCCAHTFCERCVAKYVNGPPFIITCPECRAVTECKGGESADAAAATLPLNYAVQRVIAALPLRKTRVSKCQKHDETLKLYCLTHKVMICRDCTLRDHKEPVCNWDFVSDIVQRSRDKYAALLAKAETHAQKMRDCLAANENAHSELIRERDAVQQKIDNAAQRAKEALDERVRVLTEAAEAEAQRGLAKLVQPVSDAAKSAELQASDLVQRLQQRLAACDDLSLVDDLGLEEESTRILAQAPDQFELPRSSMTCTLAPERIIFHIQQCFPTPFVRSQIKVRDSADSPVERFKKYQKLCASSWVGTNTYEFGVEARKQRVEIPTLDFGDAIYKVLQDVHPGMHIRLSGLLVLEDLIHSIVVRVADAAARLQSPSVLAPLHSGGENSADPYKSQSDHKKLDIARGLEVIGECGHRLRVRIRNSGQSSWETREALAEATERVPDTAPEGLRKRGAGLVSGWRPIDTNVQGAPVKGRGKAKGPDSVSTASEWTALDRSNLQTAVHLVLDRELGKYAVAEGTKAVVKWTQSQKRLTSAAAGLKLPVAKVGTLLASRLGARGCSAEAAVFMAAVLEYMAAEVLEYAGNAAKDLQTAFLTPRHVGLAIRGDEELDTCFPMPIAGGGIIPHVHRSLLHSNTPLNGRERESANLEIDRQAHFVSAHLTSDRCSLFEAVGNIDRTWALAGEGCPLEGTQGQPQLPAHVQPRDLLSSTWVQCVAATAGCVKLSSESYEEVRQIAKNWLEENVKVIMTAFSEHQQCDIVAVEHVLAGLREHKRTGSCVLVGTGRLRKITSVPPEAVAAAASANSRTADGGGGLAVWLGASQKEEKAAAEAAAGMQVDATHPEYAALSGTALLPIVATYEPKDNEPTSCSDDDFSDDDEVVEGVSAYELEHRGAVQMVRAAQRGSCSPLLPLAAFVPIVQEVSSCPGSSKALRWSPAALRVLYEAMQAYCVTALECAKLSAIHAGRCAVLPSDLQFWLRLSGQRS